MNTIPIIFNEKISPYTAVGKKERAASSGISAVVINRPGLSKRTIFQEIEKTGFDNIISIESCSPNYEIEELIKRFPFVRFILPENQLSLGEQINLAAFEIESPLFFVMYSDIKIIAGGNAVRMAERLSVNNEENENTKKNHGFKRLCTVPFILNSNYEILPTLTALVTYKKKIRTFLTEPRDDGDIALYPFDGIGIYDRQRFINSGGFDTSLKHSYWQLLDFGFRANLWGEEIAFNNHYKLSYEHEHPRENYSIKDCYKRFYLKNLAPVFKNDHARLPIYRFPGFYSIAGVDLSSAWNEFKENKKWVKINQYRWKSDARGVIKRWDTSNISDTSILPFDSTEE